MNHICIGKKKHGEKGTVCPAVLLLEVEIGKKKWLECEAACFSNYVQFVKVEWRFEHPPPKKKLLPVFITRRVLSQGCVETLCVLETSLRCSQDILKSEFWLFFPFCFLSVNALSEPNSSQ